MALSAALMLFIERHLRQKLLSVKPVSGGDINQTYGLQTTNSKYLIKINSKSRLPDMFLQEARGLFAIAATQTIAVPQVVLQSDVEDENFLLLEWIDTMRPTPNAFKALGRQLAEMHRRTDKLFGFTADNYMGSMPQSNRPQETWSKFFIEERLQPLVKLTVDKGYLNVRDTQNFESLYKRLPDLFSEEPPALIHGDLWSGNYLISVNEKPYLIDPAISYAHRECDIALTTLFGGFGNEFYTAYHETFPLTRGWQQRMDLWNLYPLLVHLNLFGLGYLGQVRDAVEGYV